MNSLPHLQSASETSGLKTPHGRVVAKIVCAVLPCDTLVQYAAYCFPSFGREMVSFDSDYSGGDGASPLFSQVSDTSLPLNMLGGSSGKDLVDLG